MLSNCKIAFPRITWYKDGIELDSQLNTYLHVSEDWQINVLSWIVKYPDKLPWNKINEWKLGEGKNATIKSKLEIDPARQMDSGTYECMVGW